MYIVKSFAYSLICMKQCKKKGTTYQVWRTHTHLCKDGKLFFITPQFQALKILARFSTGWRGQTDDHPWQWTLPESGCKRDLLYTFTQCSLHIGIMARAIDSVHQGYNCICLSTSCSSLLSPSSLFLLFCLFPPFSPYPLPPRFLPSLLPSLLPSSFLFFFSFLPGCRDAILGSWTEWREEPSTNSVHHALQ